MIQLFLLFLGDDNLPVVCVIPSEVCHKGTDIDAVDAVILTDEKLRDWIDNFFIWFVRIDTFLFIFCFLCVKIIFNDCLFYFQIVPFQ